jgi:hypothetical protein
MFTKKLYTKIVLYFYLLKIKTVTSAAGLHLICVYHCISCVQNDIIVSRLFLKLVAHVNIAIVCRGVVEFLGTCQCVCGALDA